MNSLKQAASSGEAPRIGVAFFYHESHSFSPLRTDLEAFRAEDLHLGEPVQEVYAGTRTELGGFLEVLNRRGATPVPLLAAAAMPSGEVTAEAYEYLVSEFEHRLSALTEQAPLDGLLLALHGSMVATQEQDPEGALVRTARSLIGDEVPIAVTFDLHANVSAEVAQNGALIFGYQTYPHVDMFEQGQRAANAVLDVCAGTELHVRTVRLPMLLRSINMRTAEGPMADVVDFARSFEGATVRAVSPHSGFPYSDTFCSNAGVSVVAASADEAERVAGAVGRYFWSQRDRFQVDVPGIVAGLTQARVALAAGETPVVLADVADNPQSGGSADTTFLLKAVLEEGLGSVMMSAIYDPAVVRLAHEAGVGAIVQTALAGKSSAAFGAPLQVHAEVFAVGDGIIQNDGPFNAGLTVDVGGLALLRLRAVVGIESTALERVDVLVTGRPITANDPALYRQVGVDPRDYDVLVWKVKNHFRAAFEPIVGRVIPVDAPGPAQTDFTQLSFVHTDRSHWPFDVDRALGEIAYDAPLLAHDPSAECRQSSEPAPDFVITEATAADLNEIAEFHVAVWQEAYSGMMDAEFLRSLSAQHRLTEWQESLAAAPAYRILIARTPEGAFLGFGSVQEHDAVGHLGLELHTLNLKPAARGTGLAGAMIDRLLEGKPSFAWVVEGNERAVEFYRRVGFELTEERRPDTEAKVDDLRMVRRAS